jgi:hypothetical protein
MLSFSRQFAHWQTGVVLRQKGNTMQSVLEPQPHYLVIHHKLKDSLSPIYLTLLSVIQGAVLADLSLVVAANYQQFTLMHWLLVLVNFGMVISIWHTFTIHITLWSWIPDLRDAIVPFMIGAIELVFNHTISMSLSAWLFVVAIIASTQRCPSGMWVSEQKKKVRTLSCWTCSGGSTACLHSIILG